MSELHLSLLIVGLIFIVAVFLFNYWQERKYRKQTEKMFRGEQQDVLFATPGNKGGDERIEPSLQTTYAAVEVGQAATNAAHPHHHEAVVARGMALPDEDDEPVAVSADESPVEPAKSRLLIDEAIDLIGVLQVNPPLASDRVKALMVRAQTFSKSVRWEGLSAGRWTDIANNQQYGELRLALQLADRRGPTTEAEISRFIALVKQFAVELDGDAHTETEESATARATELDEFCADVDVEIGVNLVANDHAMPGTKLRALAEASGMKLNNEGVFQYHDEHGALLFTLRNSEPRPFTPDLVKNITTRRITLLLDVPRVAQGVHAFDQMLQLGRQIAGALGGNVVDDNGKALTDSGADSIRRQLQVIYREMDGFGIAAGDAVALRLFS